MVAEVRDASETKVAEQGESTGQTRTKKEMEEECADRIVSSARCHSSIQYQIGTRRPPRLW
jgi:hypothetical protein